MLAAATRFAGPALAKGLRALYPALEAGSLRSAATWRGAAGEIAMDVVPNLAFAGLAGAGLPGADEASGFEGATGMERLGAGLTDFAISYPVGSAGRLLGLGGARGIGALRKRPLSPGSLALTQNIVGPVAETVFWGSGIGGNPVANSVYDRYQERMRIRQEQDRQEYEKALVEQVRQEVANERQTVAYGGMGAALAPYGFSGFG